LNGATLPFELFFVGSLGAYFQNVIGTRGEVDVGFTRCKTRFGESATNIRYKGVARISIVQFAIEAIRKERAAHLQHQVDASTQIETQLDGCGVALVWILEAAGPHNILPKSEYWIAWQVGQLQRTGHELRTGQSFLDSSFNALRAALRFFARGGTISQGGELATRRGDQL
jgi:hypothetical protein